jgi:hypothetical protein
MIMRGGRIFLLVQNNLTNSSPLPILDVGKKTRISINGVLVLFTHDHFFGY